MSRRTSAWRIGLLFALNLALAACGGQKWETHNITGLMPDLKFTLVDTHGRTVHAGDFAGKVRLLYFGYTNCPDVCPLTLADIARTLHDLGPAAASHVRVLFVSVDPRRDTPKVLHRYAKAFGPQFIGLTGTQAELQALSKRYRVSYSYGKLDAHGDYVVNHSAAIFVFDARGRARLIMNHTYSSKAMAHDLRQVLNTPR